MATPGSTGASAWARALSRTATIAANPERTLPQIIEELADASGDAPALLSDGESFSYRALAGRAARYSRWALEQGIAQGNVVGLLMPNRPEYMAIWLGISRVGGVVALINTNLTGRSLASAVNTAAPGHLIVAAGLVERISVVEQQLADAPQIWVHGDGDDRFRFPRIDRSVERHAGDALRDHERRRVTIDDRALYIYTSGTTGASKAAIVTHARILQWSQWFAGLMNTGPATGSNCLPMYHSVGGVLATGALLVSGGTVDIRDTFSARQFWTDIVGWDCTLFQYIGELCRYLLHTEPHPHERNHRIRMCCGNGLRPEVWNAFKNGFESRRFWSSTPRPRGTYRWSTWTASPDRLAASRHSWGFDSGGAREVDADEDQPVRDARGRCVRCAPKRRAKRSAGSSRNPRAGRRFDGYTNKQPRTPGSCATCSSPETWVRTGDLLKQDERGYFYFVDRVGDTFRWKGENVATSKSPTPSAPFPASGRHGLWRRDFRKRWTRRDGRHRDRHTLDLPALRSHLIDRLPDYARRCSCAFAAICRSRRRSSTRRARSLGGMRSDPTGDRSTSTIASAGIRSLDKALYDRIRRGALAQRRRDREPHDQPA
jgi:fatty-acyl-CoA synthase